MIHNDILISFSLYNTLTSLSYSYVTTQIPILNSTVLYNHSKSKFATLNINKSLTSHSQLQNPHRTIQCLSFKLKFILSPTKMRNHYFLVNFNNNSHHDILLKVHHTHASNIFIRTLHTKVLKILNETSIIPQIST